MCQNCPAIFYPLVNLQKIPIAQLNSFLLTVFFRTYLRERRLAMLRNVRDHTPLRRAIGVNNVKLQLVILRLPLRIVKFYYGISE